MCTYSSLMTSADERLVVDQIRVHPFFDGVDWASIRAIDAPFVPHLRSITDTSYFPTEDLENVPEQPAGADTSGAKDLAFLGYASSVLSSLNMLTRFTPFRYTFKRFQVTSHAF